MSDEVPQEAQVTQQVTGEVKVGLGQIGNPTPQWATWLFRIYFYLSTFTGIYLTMDNTIPAHVALNIIKYLGISVLAVHGFSKMIGIDSRKLESEAKDAFNQPLK